MFLTYAYTFHLLFNFPNEFLMKYYPYVVDKKKKKKLRLKEIKNETKKRKSIIQIH